MAPIGLLPSKCLALTNPSNAAKKKIITEYLKLLDLNPTEKTIWISKVNK
jgi:hypothetical protein